jgi:hypothetical protein
MTTKEFSDIDRRPGDRGASGPARAATPSELSLAIVGGGPMCTYALERLAALLPRIATVRLKILIFDKTGLFGSGATHSEMQSVSSYMNRVASQIAFAADESNQRAGRLLRRALRPTFFEWTQQKYRETGDETYNLRSTEVPRRYLHGQALREKFELYAGILATLENVSLSLHHAEVVDVSHDEADGRFRVHMADGKGAAIAADNILFVTGHSSNHPAPNSPAARLAAHAQRTPGCRYISQPYPLHEQLTEAKVPAGVPVAVVGLGLTAVDIFLHLTEGRGGRFVAGEGERGPLALRYIASGREPSRMIGLSPSGLFPACRPENMKAVDGSGAGHAVLEHRGVFLTVSAIRKLRQSVGRPQSMQGAEILQLDFDTHIFPLVVLEMAYVYYRTLLGEFFGEEVCRAVADRYRAFLVATAGSRDDRIAFLLEPVGECFEEAVAYMNLAAAGARIPQHLGRFETSDMLESYDLAVYGKRSRQERSPWDHPPEVAGHRFDWRKFFYPLVPTAEMDGGEWQNRLVAYMRRDHLAAAQGNLRNPVKAACDGVWRDLRSVLSELADFGGLTAASHRRFTEHYWRLYNRMSNGTGLEAMSKILALIECGLLDMSMSPGGRINTRPGQVAFDVTCALASARREVSVVVEGRAHRFDPLHDMCPLYPNLLRRGLVRQWRNPGPAKTGDYVPGALDLCRDFHPVRSDGTVDRRLTFFGAPSEGVAFFQLSAARPQSNSAILNNVARWANAFVGAAMPSSTDISPVNHDIAV